MDNDSALQGGCQCGGIRYEARGTRYHETLCHCTLCRGTSGAPAVAWFTVALSGFLLLKGAPRTWRASDHGTRSFCPTCGTQLFFREDGLGEIDITTASLDDPAALPPRDHTWARSALPWMAALDGLPRFAEARDG